jgi:hypothetical protein
MLCSGVRIQEDRHKHNRVPQQNRAQRLFPAHSRADQSGGQHVGRNAMRHRDPQRREVVCAPRTLLGARRSQVLVVKPRRVGRHLKQNTLGELELATDYTDYAETSFYDFFRPVRVG